MLSSPSIRQIPDKRLFNICTQPCQRCATSNSFFKTTWDRRPIEVFWSVLILRTRTQAGVQGEEENERGKLRSGCWEIEVKVCFSNTCLRLNWGINAYFLFLSLMNHRYRQKHVPNSGVRDVRSRNIVPAVLVNVYFLALLYHQAQTVLGFNKLPSYLAEEPWAPQSCAV